MKISIVIPVFDEAENIPPLCRGLFAALTPRTVDFEILFVDDGSRDGSFHVLQAEHAKDSRVRALSLSRRFGHQVALAAGLDFAEGQAVVTMDGDLQHPPDLIPELIRQWENGHQIVHAIRRDSPSEPSLKSASSKAFYWIFQRMSGVSLPMQAAEFRLFDRKVVESIRRFRERSRLLRGISSWVGYKATQVYYEPSTRNSGRSKYDAGRMIALAADGLVSFSSAPLYAGVWTGFALGVLTLFYVAYAAYSRLISHEVLPGWTSIAVLIGSVGSVQLMVIGLIGLYVGKIYEESKQRPLYLIQDAIGVSADRA